MFDTMTLTEIAAGLCGALLVFLLGKWAADELYHIETYKKQAYAIEVEGAEEATEVEEVDFATILASADAAAGARVFRKCGACHALEKGDNGAGPYLYGIVGRDIAAAEGFDKYSTTLAGLDGDWTVERLNAFIENPRGWASGTTMSFNGISKIEDRANLIAYLDATDD